MPILFHTPQIPGSLPVRFDGSLITLMEHEGVAHNSEEDRLRLQRRRLGDLSNGKRWLTMSGPGSAGLCAIAPQDRLREPQIPQSKPGRGLHCDIAYQLLRIDAGGKSDLSPI